MEAALFITHSPAPRDSSSTGPMSEDVAWAVQLEQRAANTSGRGLPGGPTEEELGRAMQIVIRDQVENKKCHGQNLVYIQKTILDQGQSLLQRCTARVDTSNRRECRASAATIRGFLKHDDTMKPYVRANNILLYILHYPSGPSREGDFGRDAWSARSSELERIARQLEEFAGPMSPEEEILYRIQMMCEGDTSVSVSMEEASAAANAFLMELIPTGLDALLGYNHTMLDLYGRLARRNAVQEAPPQMFKFITYWLRVMNTVTEIREVRCKGIEDSGMTCPQLVYELELLHKWNTEYGDWWIRFHMVNSPCISEAGSDAGKEDTLDGEGKEETQPLALEEEEEKWEVEVEEMD